MRNEPDFLENEEVIIISPGFYKDNLRSGWKPGHLYLTNSRLFLWQPSRIIFQIPLDSIVGISIQQRGFILRSKDALCLSYRPSGGEEISQVWIMMKDVETWEKKIFERSLLQISQESVDKIASELDHKSRTIVYYIWQNRYAPIEELASLCDASNHMDVLLRIKEVINPLAEKTIGYPLLVFEKSKIDPETGRKILFSWWLIGRKDRFLPNHERLVDIFDEGERIRVIMEIRGVVLEDLKLDFHGDRVTVRCHKIGASLRVELPLESPVSPRGYRMQIRNNLLEMQFNKENSASPVP